MKEKFCVFEAEAISEVAKIKEIISDLETFWNGDNSLSDRDYEGEADIIAMDFMKFIKKR